MAGCKHKRRFPVARGSLWAKWDWFCMDCGVCPEDPSVPARPDLAKEERERDAQMSESVKQHEAMTPEEREVYRTVMVEDLSERIKKLEDQLSPFREGLTYRPYGYF